MSDLERRIFASVVACRFTIRTKVDARHIISDAAGARARIPNRDLLIKTILALSEHLRRLRARRADATRRPAPPSLAKKRLQYEIERAFHRCDYRRSTAVDLEEVWFVNGGGKPSAKAERYSEVDSVSSGGTITSSHTRVDYTITVPWHWMRIVCRSLGDDPTVEYEGKRVLVLDLEPIKSDVDGVAFAKLTYVVPATRGLGLTVATATYDLRARRFATKPVLTGWDLLDREADYGSGVARRPHLDAHAAWRLRQRLDESADEIGGKS